MRWRVGGEDEDSDKLHSHMHVDFYHSIITFCCSLIRLITHSEWRN